MDGRARETHLEHPDCFREHRLVVLACAREGFDAPGHRPDLASLQCVQRSQGPLPEGA